MLSDGGLIAKVETTKTTKILKIMSGDRVGGMDEKWNLEDQAKRRFWTFWTYPIGVKGSAYVEIPDKRRISFDLLSICYHQDQV